MSKTHQKADDDTALCGLTLSGLSVVELPEEVTCPNCMNVMTTPTEDTPTPDYWANHTCEMTCSHIRPEDWPKQDDKQIRKQIYAFFLDGIKEVPANPSARTDAILALLQKEQLQLVSELEQGGLDDQSLHSQSEGSKSLLAMPSKRKGLPWVFVDCEARGNSAVNGIFTEFGAVHYETRETFHGRLFEATPDPANPAVSIVGKRIATDLEVATAFVEWLHRVNGTQRAVFVSDNPAYDWQWVAGMFDKAGIENPFGHSARRISDYWAGLQRKWSETQSWKRYRVTTHDHNPVNDAMGNVEAFATIQEQVNDLITKGLSQVEDTPSRPGEHKKQELERLQ